MRLAASMIAWDRAADARVAGWMAELGVTGIEVAPTALWPEPLAATPADVARARDWWVGHGIEVVAMQALLFGRGELALFGSDADRRALAEYLGGIIRLGGALGARALVFGSPKNRRVGAMDRGAAWEVAAGFFRDMAAVAREAGTVLAIEPNPPAYGCDFVTTTAEAVALVEAVDHPGFRVHLDTAALHYAGDDPAAAIPHALPRAAHVHASEPDLVPLGDGAVDHAACAAALRSAGWDGWVSLEMRAPAEPSLLRRSLERLAHWYGG